MALNSIAKQIILEMLQRKLRSFLAMFGIFWGTLAIILLLALSNGFYSASKKNVESIASGVISIMPGATGKTYKGRFDADPAKYYLLQFCQTSNRPLSLSGDRLWQKLFPLLFFELIQSL